MHFFTDVPKLDSASWDLRYVVSGDWPIDLLNESVEPVLEVIADYKAKISTLRTFALAAEAHFKEWKSMNALYEWIFAHYLNPEIPLPDFDLTDDVIRTNARVERAFEIQLISDILELQGEQKSPDFERLKTDRINAWLRNKKLPLDFFDESFMSHA